ncbi:MAG: Nif3-like dinuclear metal center hexameric protein [Microbacteriaceae bacterium]|nr:Nif3-like dinuclear metal center hexameric protein [Microbacteriaceae bacterium]
MRLTEVVKKLEEVWPVSGALEWDKVGLVVGGNTAEISKILFAVDVTFEVIDEAKAVGAELIVSHHPLLFHPVNAFTDSNWRGKVVTELIQNNIALYVAHTNADIIAGGTSDAIAKALGLSDTKPITEDGIGRIGRFKASVPLIALAQKLKEILPEDISGVKVAGDPERSIITVAICAGSGDDLFDFVQEADAYISSDLRHHPALDATLDFAVRGGPVLIDVSHWASEFLWIPDMAEYLKYRLEDVDVLVSKVRTEPWTFRA